MDWLLTGVLVGLGGGVGLLSRWYLEERAKRIRLESELRTLMGDWQEIYGTTNKEV